MMRRGTGLYTNQAGRQRRKKLHHLCATKLLPDNDPLALVDAVDLEYVLRDIQTDRGNLHADGSPHVIRLRRTTLWHFDAASGRRPPHQKLSSGWSLVMSGSPPKAVVIADIAGGLKS